jgi:PmbA protein
MRIEREFAAGLLEAALRKGADSAEVYLKLSKGLSVDAKGQEVESVESSVDFGYALRVIKDQKLGFSFSTVIDDAKGVVERAIETAQWTGPDEYLNLPGPLPPRQVEVFDPAIASLGEDAAITHAMAIEKAARDADRRITKVRKSSASFSSGETLIMNSKGVEVRYATTAASAQITVAAEDGSDSQAGWDFDGSRFLEDISFHAVGRTAAERALRLLGARTIDSVKAPVILDNSVAVDFLGIFSRLLSSESVQKGKSLLAGRLGQEVISPVVSITDDGGLPRRLGSRPADDEGVATARKDLIREGVVKGFLYNTVTARKDGVVSTGNAVKGGFAALPSVGPSNLCLIVAPEFTLPGGLFQAAERCLYVTEAMGVHTANPVSGEFSIGVSGLWVEKGVIRYPVKEAVISGNILDFFRGVEAAGDDLRYYGNMGSPSLLIGATDISA